MSDHFDYTLPVQTYIPDWLWFSLTEKEKNEAEAGWRKCKLLPFFLLDDVYIELAYDIQYQSNFAIPG